MTTKCFITEMDGTPNQVVFKSASFSPAAASDLRQASPTPISGAITLASLANGSYRQSAKVDLGATRARKYFIRAAFEFAATPTDGSSLTIYWVPSQSATAATANAAGVSGSDAAYTGYSSNASSAIKQVSFGVSAQCTVQTTATVQILEFGDLQPVSRYGSLVLLNSTGAAFHTSDANCHIVFDPVVDFGA